MIQFGVLKIRLRHKLEFRESGIWEPENLESEIGDWGLVIKDFILRTPYSVFRTYLRLREVLRVTWWLRKGLIDQSQPLNAEFANAEWKCKYSWIARMQECQNEA